MDKGKVADERKVKKIKRSQRILRRLIGDGRQQLEGRRWTKLKMGKEKHEKRYKTSEIGAGVRGGGTARHREEASKVQERHR